MKTTVQTVSAKIRVPIYNFRIVDNSYVRFTVHARGFATRGEMITIFDHRKKTLAEAKAWQQTTPKNKERQRRFLREAVCEPALVKIKQWTDRFGGKSGFYLVLCDCEEKNPAAVLRRLRLIQDQCQSFEILTDNSLFKFVSVSSSRSATQEETVFLVLATKERNMEFSVNQLGEKCTIAIA